MTRIPGPGHGAPTQARKGIPGPGRGAPGHPSSQGAAGVIFAFDGYPEDPYVLPRNAGASERAMSHAPDSGQSDDEDVGPCDAGSSSRHFAQPHDETGEVCRRPCSRARWPKSCVSTGYGQLRRIRAAATIAGLSRLAASVLRSRCRNASCAGPVQWASRHDDLG